LVKSKKQDIDSPFATLITGFKPKADRPAEPKGRSKASVA